MPTYDYECKACGHVFEFFQNMSDEPLKECPKCGQEVRRLIGGGMGIIFKGSGFYVTDNRSSSASGKKEGSESKADSDGSQKKSDSSASSGSDSKKAGSEKSSKKSSSESKSA